MRSILVHWCGSFAVRFSLHRFSATCETHKIYSISYSLKPFYLSSSDCLENSFPGPAYNLSFAHQNYECDFECRQLGNKRNAEYAPMQKEMMNGKRSQNTKTFHRKLLLFQPFFVLFSIKFGVRFHFETAVALFIYEHRIRCRIVGSVVWFKTKLLVIATCNVCMAKKRMCDILVQHCFLFSLFIIKYPLVLSQGVLHYDQIDE